LLDSLLQEIFITVPMIIKAVIIRDFRF